MRLKNPFKRKKIKSYINRKAYRRNCSPMDVATDYWNECENKIKAKSKSVPALPSKYTGLAMPLDMLVTGCLSGEYQRVKEAALHG